MNNNEKRGILIKEMRKKKKLTQQELGNLINYSDKNISKWERGISFPSDPNVIKKLTEILGITVEELLDGNLKADNLSKKHKYLKTKYIKIIILFMIFVILLILLRKYLTFL